MARFSGKVVLVTGAARGMGKATAIVFAQQDAKAVVVNDTNLDAAQRVVTEVKKCGADGFAIEANVADPKQVQRMVDDVLARFGQIDILVNNAGIARATRPLENITDEEWAEVVAVDLTGIFYCMRAVLPHMKMRRYGKIVNISSSAGRSVSTFGGAHYTASKAGVLGLTRHAAYESAPFNININAVAPGTIDTELVREFASSERLAAEAQKIPMLRVGTPQEEANLVAFLASDEAAYVMGATVDINGGQLMI